MFSAAKAAASCGLRRADPSTSRRHRTTEHKCATLQETAAAATAKWMRNVYNPDIMKRRMGDAIQLGVSGLPRTEGFRTREAERQATCTDTVHSKQLRESVMNAVSEHGMTAQALTGKAMGDFGASFAQGAASSSSDAYAQSLPARNVSAPPMDITCAASALEPQAGYPVTCGTRAQTQTDASFGKVRRILANVPEAA